MNENPSEYVATVLRKTQVITLWDRQRRMQDFYNLPKTMYVGLAKTTPWTDPNDPDISDTFPAMPDEKMTKLEELIGLQRIHWKKFAKAYITPTSEEKDAASTVYYKGLYYETTNDLEYALENGFTAVMCMMMSDRDQYFPVGISYRQVGLFVEVNHTDRYLDDEQFYQLSEEDRGHLAAVENFMPISRQLDQAEKHLLLIEF